jgi:hypothetical protein
MRRGMLKIDKGDQERFLLSHANIGLGEAPASGVMDMVELAYLRVVVAYL